MRDVRVLLKSRKTSDFFIATCVGKTTQAKIKGDRVVKFLVLDPFHYQASKFHPGTKTLIWVFLCPNPNLPSSSFQFETATNTSVLRASRFAHKAKTATHCN